MKKGFISMTIIYSFLLLFIFTLLSLLVLYSQKSRLIDSIVFESKEQLFFKDQYYKVIFEYTGDYQKYVVRKSGYYFIEAFGAQGGNIDTPSNSTNSTYKGGKGGYTSGYIQLNEGDILYVYVGGQGNVTSQEANQTADGGYNGGGAGKNYTSSGRISTSGGGATDIRYFGSLTLSSNDLEWDSPLGLISRIMVAGGGGGSFSCITCLGNYSGTGGLGGGLIGGFGNGRDSYENVSHSNGGTQTENKFGKGFDADAAQKPGGGGGYYGGNSDRYAAGGGSSFISGYEGCNAVSNSVSNITHTNSPNHYSGKIFERGIMEQGSNSGDGKASIEYVGIALPTS